MLPAVVDCLACPYCGLPLSAVDGAVRCARGHSFDLARQGYVIVSPVYRATSALTDVPALLREALDELARPGHPRRAAQRLG